MMIHRCSDNGRGNGRLTPVHVNEGKCKECRLFITVIIGPGSLEVNLGGLPLPFILGLTEAKVVCKINMLTRQTYSNAQPPFGIICQLLQVCLYVQVHSRQL